MHYLTHGASFAIVEDDGQAAKHVAAGWTLATLDAVRALWRARDLATLAAWMAAVTPTETAPLTGRDGTIVTRMANGWTLYNAEGKKVE